MTTATYPEITKNGISYYLEPCENDILIMVNEEALIDGVTLFNKVLKNGFSDLCSIVEREELRHWQFGKREEAKLLAKEQLKWYVELNFVEAEDLID